MVCGAADVAARAQAFLAAHFPHAANRRRYSESANSAGSPAPSLVPTGTDDHMKDEVQIEVVGADEIDEEMGTEWASPAMISLRELGVALLKHLSTGACDNLAEELDVLRQIQKILLTEGVVLCARASALCARKCPNVESVDFVMRGMLMVVLCTGITTYEFIHSGLTDVLLQYLAMSVELAADPLRARLVCMTVCACVCECVSVWMCVAQIQM